MAPNSHFCCDTFGAKAAKIKPPSMPPKRLRAQENSQLRRTLIGEDKPGWEDNGAHRPKHEGEERSKELHRPQERVFDNELHCLTHILVGLAHTHRDVRAP